MNPIDWLDKNAPGFAVLTVKEQKAIMHFSLLWSLFEAEVLHTNASANAILAIAHEWASTGHLCIESFEKSLAYFRTRYFPDDQPSEFFEGLRLRSNDNKGLVCDVLKGDNRNHADSVAALLIIVLRLRNNLFHGVKWAYGIRGQHANFENANTALMIALETHRRYKRV
jgi:hypothetical protein